MICTHLQAQAILALAARALLASIFLVMGYRHIVDRPRVTASMAAQGLPFTRVLIVCAILIEISGGTLLLIGFGARNRLTIKATASTAQGRSGLLQQLRRDVISEICLGAAVVVIVGCLGVTPPARH